MSGFQVRAVVLEFFENVMMSPVRTDEAYVYNWKTYVYSWKTYVSNKKMLQNLSISTKLGTKFHLCRKISFDSLEQDL